MKKIKLSEQDLIKLIRRVLSEDEAPQAETRYETNMERLARQNPETVSYLQAMQKAQQQQGSNISTWLQTPAEPKQVVKQGGGYSYDKTEVAPMDSRRPAVPTKPMNEVDSVETSDALSSLNLPEDVINMAACYQDPTSVVDSLDNPELVQKAASDRNLNAVLKSLDGKSTQELMSEFKRVKSLMGNIKEQAGALASVAVFGIPVLPVFLGLILLGIVVSLFKKRGGDRGFSGGGHNACRRKKSIHKYWRQQGSGFGL
jgi:hypothetical protein